jgi:ribosomal protein L35
MFKFHSIGYRHLNRNKTNRNLAKKRGRFLHDMGDIKKAKKMIPYFRRRKYLR